MVSVLDNMLSSLDNMLSSIFFTSQTPKIKMPVELLGCYKTPPRRRRYWTLQANLDYCHKQK